ncbi:MAG: PKD domain-containing protein [Bacteroidia bacterium]|nr:PKD domain-containing protein [Bacteroidia bacterium]
MRILVISFIIIFPYVVHCQSFYKRYGNSYSGAALTVSNDSNLLIATSPPGLLKTDLSGNFIFQKSYSGFSNSTVTNFIVASEENGAYISLMEYYSSDIYAWILKVDSIGNPIWAKKISRSSRTTIKGMIKLHDGNLLISGTDSSSAMIVKMDTSGNEIWSKHFHNSFQQTQTVSSPIELPDHSILFCGGILDYFNCLTQYPPYFPQTLCTQLAYTSKLDSAGNIIFSKGFYYTTEPYSQYGIVLFGTNVFYSSENKIYVSFGYHYNNFYSGAQFSLAKLDNNGNFESALTGYNVAPFRVINEDSNHLLNVLFPGGASGDIYFSYSSTLYKIDPDFTSISYIQYFPFGSPDYPSFGKLWFNDELVLSNKELVYVGKIVDSQYMSQSGISLVLCDSTGLEDCISYPGGPYIPSVDSAYSTHNLTLQVDTGITIQNILISSNNIIPNICSCLDNPIANFSYTIVDSVVSFTNTSTSANIYQWYFGDNVTSTEENPTHTYSDTGTYQVNLYAYNSCGVDFVSFLITMNLSSIKNNSFSNTVIGLYPNPANSILHINTEYLFEHYEIINSIGEVLCRNKYTNEIEVSFLNAGIYSLRLINSNKTIVKNFSIVK